MSAVQDRWQHVAIRIAHACTRFERDPNSVRLIAVSKTFPLEDISDAAQAGATEFGENYVQEAVAKIVAAQALSARERSHVRWTWHFIGPLQSNKTRDVAEHFDWVHTLDRLKIAERLSSQRPAHLDPLRVCIQVNVSGEATKSGVAPEQACELAHAIARLPRLELRGFMAIPEATEAFEAQRRPFARVRALFEECNAQGLALDTLSMGMSADLEAAIAEGATMVRVGSAIFGARAVKRDESPASS